MNKMIISVSELTKRFGDFTAVDHISFEVGRGEIFGFLGANGAGKTTGHAHAVRIELPDLRQRQRSRLRHHDPG